MRRWVFEVGIGLGDIELEDIVVVAAKTVSA